MKTILVADDEPSIRTLLEIFLADAYQVVVAASGEEALNLVASSRPDLALLDITMPRLNGIEVARRLRGCPETANLPVILLSGWGNPDEIDVPISGYLSKPFKREDLLKAVSTAIPQ